MNWVKGLVCAACLAAPLPIAVGGTAYAETAKAETAAADTTKMSETDKRAKAIECSKQADEKKLHGKARKEFRETCKRGK